VVDVSEMGIRFVCPRINPLELEKIVRGNVIFEDGESYEVSGDVVRYQNEMIALRLYEGPPYSKIVSEQRRLHQKYPRLFGLEE